jgi:hypothetical protein
VSDRTPTQAAGEFAATVRKAFLEKGERAARMLLREKARELRARKAAKGGYTDSELERYERQVFDLMVAAGKKEVGSG